MFLHWLTTGWRSLVANPLFSLITIASLSIGCCGALLAGANIKQHLSFERWLPHADHIVLVRIMSAPAAGSAEANANALRGRTSGFSDMVPPALHNAIDGRLSGMAAQTRVLRQ